MRVLLDECLPRRLARELAGHEVETVSQAGWAGVANGELLRLAATRFDALVTIDQRFAGRTPVPPGLLVVTLAAPSNRLDDLLPLVPGLLAALATSSPGRRVRIAP